MNSLDAFTAYTPTHQLRFDSLFDAGRALSFPCDSVGRVALDGLSERGRSNYLYARALIGRDFNLPVVVAVDLRH